MNRTLFRLPLGIPSRLPFLPPPFAFALRFRSSGLPAFVVALLHRLPASGFIAFSFRDFERCCALPAPLAAWATWRLLVCIGYARCWFGRTTRVHNTRLTRSPRDLRLVLPRRAHRLVSVLYSYPVFCLVYCLYRSDCHITAAFAAAYTLCLPRCYVLISAFSLSPINVSRVPFAGGLSLSFVFLSCQRGTFCDARAALARYRW